MVNYDLMDTSDTYSYGLDLSGIKFGTSRKASRRSSSADDSLTKKLSGSKSKVTDRRSIQPLKRYIVIDLEMTQFIKDQHSCIPGAQGEVIEFGAVMLDENYNKISSFDSYVRPVYSSVTPEIEELTGITNEKVSNADDFITVLDKYASWRGDGDIKTFCWSRSDHNQLFNELLSKGRQRDDLFDVLKDFADLQDIFSKLVESRTKISLESAMSLLQMNYEGQIHCALWDAYNTARILHKIFCTDTLEVEYSLINHPQQRNSDRDEDKYTSSMSSFIPKELLAKFAPQLLQQMDNPQEEKSEETTTDCKKDDINPEKQLAVIQSSFLTDYVHSHQILNLCQKYHIPAEKWVSLTREVQGTSEMLSK